MKELIIKKYVCDELIGTHLNDSHYDILVQDNCDLYSEDSFDGTKKDESNIIFKFRKNVFDDKKMNDAYEAFKGAAIITDQRGSAAGQRIERNESDDIVQRDWVSDKHLEIVKAFANYQPTLVDEKPIDVLENINLKYGNNKNEIGNTQSKSVNRGLTWFKNATVDIGWKFEDWENEINGKDFNQLKEESQFILKTKISSTDYANKVMSGVLGSLGRYPRLPFCRQTIYTRENSDKIKKGYPFIQDLAKYFEKLLPNRYNAQLNQSKKVDNSFIIPETPFTTITVNKNFRTAAHRDAGDLSEGFSNLLVLSNDKNYTGGYLVLPEYRVAVDVRPGDLLLINNHDGIHGNTDFSGEIGYERISLVCYFRENMIECGEEKYERLRYDFCHKFLKSKKDHPNWTPNWSGTFPKMWESELWYDYLKENGGEEMLNKYHSDISSSDVNLENFFER